jgi:phosphoglycolate phosphatase
MPPNPNIQAVLFDLDGTLLDTARDFDDALNKLRAEENLAPIPYETIRAQVSHGGHALVKLGFGVLPPAEHEVMRMRLLNIYRQQLAKHTCLFDGGGEMLTELERRGLAWGVVTNKPGWLTEPLMVAVNLHSRGQRRHALRAQAASPAPAARSADPGRGSGELRVHR